jgi:hypothetical protein
MQHPPYAHDVKGALGFLSTGNCHQDHTTGQDYVKQADDNL